MEQAPKEPHPAPAVEAPNVQELIEKTLSERETKARADANLSEVNVALTKHYGDPAKAKEAVEAKAASLGMSSKDISSLAARSPAAAMELLGLKIETKPQVSIGTKSSVNLAAAPAETAATTKAQFDEMRRKNPGQYWSPAVQRKLKELVAEGKYFS